MNFKNMKIEINQEQPLDEVVMEFKRLGCSLEIYYGIDTRWVLCNVNHVWNIGRDWWHNWLKEYTLAELKEMKE